MFSCDSSFGNNHTACCLLENNHHRRFSHGKKNIYLLSDNWSGHGWAQASTYAAVKPDFTHSFWKAQSQICFCFLPRERRHTWLISLRSRPAELYQVKERQPSTKKRKKRKKENTGVTAFLNLAAPVCTKPQTQSTWMEESQRFSKSHLCLTCGLSSMNGSPFRSNLSIKQQPHEVIQHLVEQ